jgi:hypothetical protein
VATLRARQVTLGQGHAAQSFAGGGVITHVVEAGSCFISHPFCRLSATTSSPHSADLLERVWPLTRFLAQTLSLLRVACGLMARWCLMRMCGRVLCVLLGRLLLGTFVEHYPGWPLTWRKVCPSHHHRIPFTWPAQQEWPLPIAHTRSWHRALSSARTSKHTHSAHTPVGQSAIFRQVRCCWWLHLGCRGRSVVVCGECVSEAP